MSNNTVKVNVKGQITSAIVDSGAAVTILSKVFFEKTAYFGSELQNPDFFSCDRCQWTTFGSAREIRC